jgi:hypothetical protein
VNRLFFRHWLAGLNVLAKNTRDSADHNNIHEHGVCPWSGFHCHPIFARRDLHHEVAQLHTGNRNLNRRRLPGPDPRGFPAAHDGDRPIYGHLSEELPWRKLKTTVRSLVFDLGLKVH